MSNIPPKYLLENKNKNNNNKVWILSLLLISLILITTGYYLVIVTFTIFSFLQSKLDSYFYCVILVIAINYYFFLLNTTITPQYLLRSLTSIINLIYNLMLLIHSRPEPCYCQFAVI
jgi:hypothetical protein